ncbi:MAG: carboxymuconolactone decarboxylase family protein [Deltaproteobacteria bacterium]|nr:carboxymuconolactone decarboxylase family protein [Deltaproteobacteria bacterium]
MARIKTVGPREAKGEIQELYRLILTAFPLIPNVFQAFSLSPPLLRAIWKGHVATIQSGKMPRRTKETVAVQTSRANACPYCVGAHTMFLKAIGMSEAQIETLGQELSGEAQSPLGDLWQFVEEVVQRPKMVAPPLVAAATRSVGGECEFLEAVAITGYFTRVNLVVNALGVLPDLPAPLMRFELGQRIGRAMASRLTRARVDFTPKPVVARPAAETLALLEADYRNALGAPLPPFLRRFEACPEILEAEASWLGVIARPGAMAPAWVPLIESAVADEEGFPGFGAASTGRDRAAGHSAAWDRAEKLARSVARASYRLTDAEFDEIRAAGFSDEAILEIVASAAYWCGTIRMAAALGN